MKVIKVIAVGTVTISVIKAESDIYYINTQGETLPKKFTADEVIEYLMSIMENKE